MENSLKTCETFSSYSLIFCKHHLRAIHHHHMPTLLLLKTLLAFSLPFQNVMMVLDMKQMQNCRQRTLMTVAKHHMVIPHCLQVCSRFIASMEFVMDSRFYEDVNRQDTHSISLKVDFQAHHSLSFMIMPVASIFIV